MMTMEISFLPLFHGSFTCKNFLMHIFMYIISLCLVLKDFLIALLIAINVPYSFVILPFVIFGLLHLDCCFLKKHFVIK